MRLQPLYRATFTTPDRWAVEIAGTHGTEVQDFLIAEGRTEGLFAWHGYARPGAPDRREIVWQHYPGDWQRALSVVNNAVCAMSGEVRPRKAEEDFDVVYDVAELIWEPLD